LPYLGTEVVFSIILKGLLKFAEAYALYILPLALLNTPVKAFKFKLAIKF